MLQDVCQLALTVKCIVYTQKAACNAFIKLIELFEDYDLKLDETLKKFTNTFDTYEEKSKKKSKNVEYDLNYVQNDNILYRSCSKKIATLRIR